MDAAIPGRPDPDHLELRCRLLEEVVRLNQYLSTALSMPDKTRVLRGMLSHLARLASAQVAYLVFLHEDAVVSAWFHSSREGVDFNLATMLTPGKEVIQDGLLPEGGCSFDEAHMSHYGGLTLRSSVVLPFNDEGCLCGLLQVGNFEGQLSAESEGFLKSLGHFLKSGLMGLRSHEMNSVARRQVTVWFEKLRHDYDILVSNSHDIMVCFDSDCRILELNAMGQEVLGVSGYLPSFHIEFTNPGSDTLLVLLRTRRVITDLEVVMVVKNREQRFCLGSFSAEFDDHGELAKVHGVLKDITDRIEIQSQLMKANMDLAEVNDRLKLHQQQVIQQEKLASIGQLAAGVAHEINNPLGFIMSNHSALKDYFRIVDAYIGELESRCGSGDDLRKTHKVGRILEDLPELLHESDEGFDRIAKIVKSLKDFSHVDAQGRFVAANLNKALEDTITIARNNWKYVAEVKVDFALESLVEVQLDALNQVFLNLLVNAAQAIKAQNRTETGTIRIWTRQEGDKAVICFDDDGPGIPEAVRNRIFEPFFTTKPVGEGTGLGLSMAWDIIKKHSGSIILDKSPSGGASFLVELPLLQTREMLPE